MLKLRFFFNQRPLKPITKGSAFLVIFAAFTLLFQTNKLSAQSSKLLTSTMLPYCTNGCTTAQNEGVKNVLDRNVNTKFLDANKVNTGFYVNTSIDSRVTKIELTTADDHPENDPSGFILMGSNNGNDWTAIYSNSLPCNSRRLYTLGFTFTNFEIFSWYKIEFTNVCNAAAAKAMQIAEVQLYRSSITLPIKLISFEGQLTGKQVKLYWKLAQPEENALFEIQKSTDGQNFHLLNIMTKSAYSTQFAYTDLVNGNGNLYYRLKITEITGEVTYSNVVALKADTGHNGISIYPNPLIGSNLIHVTIFGEMINGWSLINSTGQKIAENRKVMLPGKTDIALPNTLIQGIYYLQFQSEKGNYTQKLLIR